MNWDRSNQNIPKTINLFEESKLNITLSQNERNFQEIDQTVQEFIDFSNEDHISEIEINPSFNDLLRRNFPNFFKNTTFKYESSLLYITNMYEILRESFMEPIKLLLHKLLDVKNIEQFKEIFFNEQKKMQNEILKFYNVATKKVSLTDKGLLATFLVEQNYKYEHMADILNFQDLKKQSLVILINQKSGAMLFGTVMRYKQEVTDQDDQDEEQKEEQQEEDDEEDYIDEQEKQFQQQEAILQGDNSLQQDEGKSYEKLEKFHVQIKINMNSNNFSDVIQQFSSNEKQFIMLEATHYWLPVYYNLKVLYYMKQKEDKLQLPFEEQILQGKNLPDDCFPEYQQLQDNPQQIEIRKEDIFEKIHKVNCDEYQKHSLKEMLTKKIHFVEGPPGTGKSFMAVNNALILSTLYSTSSQIWKPIIILCKKNVSLDSFLKNLIQNFEKSVLRVGTTTDVLIKEFTLKKELQKYKGLGINDSEKTQVRYQFERTLFTAKETKLNCTKIHKIYQKFGLDLPQLYLEKFMNEYFSQLKINKNSFSELKEYLFTSWFENKLNHQVLIKYLKGYSAIEKKINYEIEDKLLDLCKLYNNNNTDSEIEDIYRKPLIDQQLPFQFTKKQEKFQLRNEKNQFNIETQIFIQRVQQINKFTDFDGLLRKYLIQFALYQLKLEKIDEEYQIYKTDLNKIREERSKKYEHAILQILSRHKIIGMTTTGFMMRFKFIQMLKPEILIVEEASEIDEWNCATFYQPYIKHIIQIGDYKQLTPIQSNKNFIYKHNLGISQFERLLSKLKLNSSKLIKQRRMLSELADFPRQIYKNKYYQDDEEIQKRLLSQQQQYGLKYPIIFINHTFRETMSKNSPSYQNIAEAFMAVHIAQSLNKHYGIPKSEIVILCMYRTQKNCIEDQLNKSLIRQNMYDDDEQTIEVSTVDEYQGKENNYIILSCVRCNENNQLGFIEEKNRINIAFSRARLGLIALGAFWMYSVKSTTWEHFEKVAESHKSIISDIEQLNEIFPKIGNIIRKEMQKNGQCIIDSTHPPHLGECNKSKYILTDLNRTIIDIVNQEEQQKNEQLIQVNEIINQQIQYHTDEKYLIELDQKELTIPKKKLKKLKLQQNYIGEPAQKNISINNVNSDNFQGQINGGDKMNEDEEKKQSQQNPKSQKSKKLQMKGDYLNQSQFLINLLGEQITIEHQQDNESKGVYFLQDNKNQYDKDLDSKENNINYLGHNNQCIKENILLTSMQANNEHFLQNNQKLKSIQFSKEKAQQFSNQNMVEITDTFQTKVHDESIQSNLSYSRMVPKEIAFNYNEDSFISLIEDSKSDDNKPNIYKNIVNYIESLYKKMEEGNLTTIIRSLEQQLIQFLKEFQDQSKMSYLLTKIDQILILCLKCPNDYESFIKNVNSSIFSYNDDQNIQDTTVKVFHQAVLKVQFFEHSMQQSQQSLNERVSSIIHHKSIINCLIDMMKKFIFFNNKSFIRKLISFSKNQNNIIDLEWVILQSCFKEILEKKNCMKDIIYIGQICDQISSFSYDLIYQKKKSPQTTYELKQVKFEITLQNQRKTSSKEDQQNTQHLEFLHHQINQSIQQIYKKKIILLIRSKDDWIFYQQPLQHEIQSLEEKRKYHFNDECYQVIIFLKDEDQEIIQSDSNEKTDINTQDIHQYKNRLLNSIFIINQLLNQ